MSTSSTSTRNLILGGLGAIGAVAGLVAVTRAARQRTARSAILIVGSINADVFIDIDRLPKDGETISSSRPDSGHVMPGGKGANQAVCVASLLPSDSSFAAHWCGRFGNDSHTSMLKRVLASHNVEANLASNADVPTGQAYIFRKSDGSNSIILVGAANHVWPSEIPPPLKAALSTAACVLLQREVPEAVNLAVALVARAAGVPVFLDMGGEDSPMSSELLSALTFLTANETELARVSGMPTDTDDQVTSAAQHVRRTFGVSNILITLGSRGAMLFTPESEEPVVQPALKVESVIDTTGAGDCFRGAFAVAVLEKRSWAECLKFASAASALCIQTKGALPSMPKRQQVDELLRSQQ